MTGLDSLKRKLVERRPVRCEKCGGKLFYNGGGQYCCKECGTTVLDDFGRIREYLSVYGPTSQVILSAETGVDLDIVEYYVKDGRLEVVKEPDFYHSCERCGCSISYGRFCHDCYSQMRGEIRSAFTKKGTLNPASEHGFLSNADLQGKMHYVRKE